MLSFKLSIHPTKKVIDPKKKKRIFKRKKNSFYWPKRL